MPAPVVPRTVVVRAPTLWQAMADPHLHWRLPFTHYRPLKLPDSWNVCVHSCHHFLDHVQFTLIHEPNILDSYAVLSLQHWTLLSPPDTTTTERHFHFTPAYLFFLELFLCSSPVAYLTPTDMGGSSSHVISFCHFIVFIGFSSQENWGSLSFPSPVDDILSGPG